MAIGRECQAHRDRRAEQAEKPKGSANAMVHGPCHGGHIPWGAALCPFDLTDFSNGGKVKTLCSGLARCPLRGRSKNEALLLLVLINQRCQVVDGERRHGERMPG
jgi:hypothetical protein